MNYYAHPSINWGMQIIPSSNGHTAIISYFPHEVHSDTESSSEFFEILRNITEAKGTELEIAISKWVLNLCENITISPDMWEAISKRRKDAILNAFYIKPTDQIVTETYIQNLPQITNPKRINLF